MSRIDGRQFDRMQAEIAEHERMYAELLKERDLLRGAMDAQDERERRAGVTCGVAYELHGCDWPHEVAELVVSLRAENARLLVYIAGQRKVLFTGADIDMGMVAIWDDNSTEYYAGCPFCLALFHDDRLRHKADCAWKLALATPQPAAQEPKDRKAALLERMAEATDIAPELRWSGVKP